MIGKEVQYLLDIIIDGSIVLLPLGPLSIAQVFDLGGSYSHSSVSISCALNDRLSPESTRFRFQFICGMTIELSFLGPSTVQAGKWDLKGIHLITHIKRSLWNLFDFFYIISSFAVLISTAWPNCSLSGASSLASSVLCASQTNAKNGGISGKCSRMGPKAATNRSSLQRFMNEKWWARRVIQCNVRSFMYPMLVVFVSYRCVYYFRCAHSWCRLSSSLSLHFKWLLVIIKIRRL